MKVCCLLALHILSEMNEHDSQRVLTNGKERTCKICLLHVEDVFPLLLYYPRTYALCLESDVFRLGLAIQILCSMFCSCVLHVAPMVYLRYTIQNYIKGHHL